MRTILKLMAVLSVAAIANTAIAQATIVSANSVLTTDQVAKLRIERQQFIDQRTADEQALDACRVQVKTLVDYWTDKNPTVLEEVAKLAAVHATIAAGSGAGVSAGGAWALSRFALLPDTMFWKLAKATPAIAGLGVAAYYTYVDGLKYYYPIKQVLDSTDKESLYVQIRQNETNLVGQIGQLDAEITNLDEQLRPYDSFDQFDQKHYSAKAQYSPLKYMIKE